MSAEQPAGGSISPGRFGMAAPRTGGQSRLWQGHTGRRRRSVPWSPPPIQQRCLSSRPGTWSRTRRPHPMARKAHSLALRPAWRRSSGSTGSAPGSSKATNRSNMPWAGRTVRCAAIRQSAIRRDFQLVCCAFSFCWYHVSHPDARPMPEAAQPPELAVLPEANVPAESAGTREKNQHRKEQAAPGVLANGEALGARLAGAVDHAAALLARVVRAAPTRPAPRLA